MEVLFDEKNLKEALQKMSENEREQYVNGVFDLLGVPKLTKQNNNNLDIAYKYISLAITFARSTITPQERTNIENYFAKLNPPV